MFIGRIDRALLLLRPSEGRSRTSPETTSGNLVVEQINILHSLVTMLIMLMSIELDHARVAMSDPILDLVFAYLPKKGLRHEKVPEPMKAPILESNFILTGRETGFKRFDYLSDKHVSNSIGLQSSTIGTVKNPPVLMS